MAAFNTPTFNVKKFDYSTAFKIVKGYVPAINKDVTELVVKDRKNLYLIVAENTGFEGTYLINIYLIENNKKNFITNHLYFVDTDFMR